MTKVYDKAITIERLDEATEEWAPLFGVHAHINKSKSDDQYLSSGSTHTRRSLTFEVRYFSLLETIAMNLQRYRVMYRGVPYALEDYDDYLERHKTVKLIGVSYER